ncbi:zinc finger MYM-type protein 1-like isoform X1 [Betta splendens]|uniref:Zinc finger MYM-type protein 1-like isoform X1 n=1 Tax=Betta splendens TaxID=158456 RepID=A0A6P7LXY0_BETSP|nr:zinc finger MYM-type protein 1-like isoform X1 [Betta splendens]XP_028998772.1 zinc finger MYM-type protein 1-like isoform X1 [Betta splendens]
MAALHRDEYRPKHWDMMEGDADPGFTDPVDYKVEVKEEELDPYLMDPGQLIVRIKEDQNYGFTDQHQYRHEEKLDPDFVDQHHCIRGVKQENLDSDVMDCGQNVLNQHHFKSDVKEETQDLDISGQNGGINEQNQNHHNGGINEQNQNHHNGGINEQNQNHHNGGINEQNQDHRSCDPAGPTDQQVEESYISQLKRFSKLDFKSKQKLISDGRPTPELKGLFQTTGQKTTRSFQMDWYTRKDWLCGCAATNRLYCFPCLLFSTCDNVWTNTGYCDIKNLPRSLSKHERSTAHIQNQITLKTFGVPRISVALNEQRRLNVSVHNAKVKENRALLRSLIDAACFLAQQRLPFGRNSSSDAGNFVELLHAFAAKDEQLARHLETSTVFSGLSDKIQDHLIEALGDLIRNDIKQEINAAKFVAVEVDETNKVQISAILRYVVLKSDACEVKEAFLGFTDVSDRRAPAVAAFVLGVLEEYKCVEKLVAQTYDGAVVMTAELDAVQARVREKAPEAMFTHCYAHNLNLVLMQSANCLPASRAFFQSVEGLGTFFSQSTKRTSLLDQVMKRRLPSAAATGWSTNSRWLQIISTYLSDLRAVFHDIGENPDSWDNDTLMMAAGYEQWLSKTSTCFLIMAYEGIFIETDALFKVLQNKVMDIEFCCARIQETVGVIEGMRQEFDTFYEQFEQKCSTLGLTQSGSKRSVRDERRRMFSNILNNVIAQMRARFDHFTELSFLDLLDWTKFHKISQNVDDKLQCLSKYARFFDFVRLKADLIGLYSSQIVRKACKSPGQLLGFLAQKDLLQTVPEATKFLQLALTVPATTATVEMSTLKRVKAYSRNRTDPGQLSSLPIISIEAERLLKLKENKEDFYNKVTELFVEKDKRMDFIYK